MIQLGIKVGYFDLTSHNCMQAMIKIANTTTSGAKAYEIKKMFSEFKKAKKTIQEHYEKDIVANFSKRDEKGEIIPEDPSKSHPEGFNLDADKGPEFEKAKAEFGKNEVTLYCRPLTLEVISDVKLSANEMDALGVLLTDK